MAKRPLLGIAITACIAPLLLCAQQAVQTGSVEGVLKAGDNGTLIGDANIWLEPTHPSALPMEWLDAEHTEYIARLPSSNGPSGTKTDAKGAFAITGVPVGEYSVLFYVPGYISPRDLMPSLRPKITIDPGKAVHIDLLSQRGGTIEGTVTFADSRPGYAEASSMNTYAGIAVDVDKKEPDGTFERALGAAHTDRNGSFRIEGIPPGSYVVFCPLGGEMVPTNRGQEGSNGPMIYHGGAKRPDRATVITVTGSETHSGVKIELPSTGFHTVSGKVEAPDGAAITEGRVVIAPVGAKEAPGEQFTFIRTDGTFKIPQVANDTYAVSIQFEPTQKFLGITPDGQGIHVKLTEPPFAASPQQVIVKDGDPAPLLFHLVPAK